MHALNRKILDIKKFIIIGSLCLLFINTTSIDTANTNKKRTFPETIDYNIPFLQKDFIGFKEALAFKESQGNYNAVNTLGYLGKYQFGKSTLRLLKIYDTKKFLKNPELQEKAFLSLCKVNKWILRKDIERSVGKTINGIKITESGILAAAHLGGPGNVKKFLRTNGRKSFYDAYGTSIKLYLEKFGGYDVSSIVADRKASV